MNAVLKYICGTLVACVLILCLSGCGLMVHYNVAKPINPKTSPNPDTFIEIDTCTPTLAWEPVGEFSRIKVEFWELAIYQDNGWTYNWLGSGTKNDLGEPVYYVEKVYGARHTISEPLPMGQDYLWTVRPHWTEGSKLQTIKGWATFDNPSYFDHASGAMGRGASRRVTGALFTFATPLRYPQEK